MKPVLLLTILFKDKENIKMKQVLFILYSFVVIMTKGI